MPRGGGAGPSRGKKNYKGQRRHFTDENELEEQAKKTEREKEWRRQRGGAGSDEEDDGNQARARNRDFPPTDSESGSEESSDEEEKPKGVSHLIEIENPNRMGGKSTKKVTEMGEGGTASLSRREREEIQKQEAQKRYQALHMAGKTDEAQADLARLAIIRKKREEAAKLRELEQKAKEEAKSKSKS